MPLHGRIPRQFEDSVRAALEGGRADLGVLAVVELDGDAGDVAPLAAVASLRQAIAAGRARGAFGYGLGVVTTPLPAADQPESRSLWPGPPRNALC